MCCKPFDRNIMVFNSNIVVYLAVNRIVLVKCTSGHMLRRRRCKIVLKIFHFAKNVFCPMNVTFVAVLIFKSMKIFRAIVALV